MKNVIFRTNSLLIIIPLLLLIESSIYEKMASLYTAIIAFSVLTNGFQYDIFIFKEEGVKRISNKSQLFCAFEEIISYKIINGIIKSVEIFTNDKNFSIKNIYNRKVIHVIKMIKDKSGAVSNLDFYPKILHKVEASNQSYVLITDEQEKKIVKLLRIISIVFRVVSIILVALYLIKIFSADTIRLL